MEAKLMEQELSWNAVGCRVRTASGMNFGPLTIKYSFLTKCTYRRCGSFFKSYRSRQGRKNTGDISLMLLAPSCVFVKK